MGDGMPRLLTNDESFALVQNHSRQAATDEAAKMQRGEAQRVYDEAIRAWEVANAEISAHNEEVRRTWDTEKVEYQKEKAAAAAAKRKCSLPKPSGYHSKAQTIGIFA